MAKTAKKKTAAKAATKSPKVKKAAPVKAAPKAKKAKPVKAAPKARKAAEKPVAKTARRSAADVAKLQKAILKGLKAKKSAAVLAEELGISRPYVYILKNKG